MVHDLIEQAAYMAHGYCLLWKPWLVALHAGSDLVIAAAYFAIPLAIFRFERVRVRWEFSYVAWLFFAFIALCGLTHFISVLTLWQPIYEFEGFVKLATAGVSFATAVVIYPLVPAMAALPSPAALQEANARLESEVAAHRATLAELEQVRADLAEKVEQRTRALSEAKERFEALVMGTSQAAWSMSAEGRAIDDAPSWRRTTGQTLDEWLGWGWLDAVHPEDRPDLLRRWEEAKEGAKLYAAEYRLKSSDGTWVWSSARAVPLFDEQGQIREWVGMNLDISERKRAEELTLIAMRELSHRTKNLLAIIGAMARQSLRPGESTADYVSEFSARLQGLSKSHDLLVQRDWSGVRLDELVTAQLSVFGSCEDMTIEGPTVILSPQATQSIGMAIFELATNAVKHGDWLDDPQSVTVTWRTEGIGEGKDLILEWRERAAEKPTLPPADHRGFGTSVITRAVRDALDAEVDYEVSKAGVFWRMRARLLTVTSRS